MHVQREHVLVLAPRLPLAAASWVVLIWQAGMMAGMGLTMELGIGVFLAVWVVMMVAMMFPATTPMNLAFARVQRERGSFGRAGAFRLGLAHGLYCLGANWLLCVLLFAVGLMNIAAMVVLTGLIFAEKVFPRAERIAWIAGLALILYSLLLISVPAALPLNGAGM
jgi:predicted metal-binding membrane protein